MTESIFLMKRNHFHGLLFLLMLAAGMFRVASTYTVFSHTIDEPAHVGPGIQWLDQGKYDYDYQHPPLARVATAIGIYLSGIRSFHKSYLWDEGIEILHANNTYDRNLVLARAGILPFFVLGVIVLYVYVHRFYDERAALIATFLFTTLPPVLAHAGMATTDMALTSTFLLSIFAFLLWIERPDGIRSIFLGMSVALSVLSKFSALVFFPACATAILAVRAVVEKKREISNRSRDAGWFRPTAAAVIVFFVMVWGGYRFSVGAVSDPGKRPHATIDRYLGDKGPLHDAVYAALEAPIYPMPDFFRGINHLRMHNESGHKGQYLFGKVSQTSWWYFFFVPLAVKTPLAFLVLLVAGIFVQARQWSNDPDWRTLVPPLCAVVIFLVCVPSHIKLGIRHIMQIYPFLAIVAAVGVSGMWKFGSRHFAVRTIVVGLLLWQFAVGILAHPDYLPYFNEIAGNHPEKILGDSDLDWGQDLKRLTNKLEEMGIEEAHVAISSSEELNRLGPPKLTKLLPYDRVKGWIAVSLFRLEYDHGQPPFKGYSWLKSYEPVAFVGKTIRLYHIKDPSLPR